MHQLDPGGPPRLVDGTGEPLDRWTPAYEALTADHEAVQALEAWLEHQRRTARLELPPAAPPISFRLSRLAGWGNPRAGHRRVLTRRKVFGVADSGVLVCTPRDEDHWAAAIALYSFRDDGLTYAKRMLNQQPADVLAQFGPGICRGRRSCRSPRTTAGSSTRCSSPRMMALP